MDTKKQRKLQLNKHGIPVDLRISLDLVEVCGELDPFELNPRDPGGYMDEPITDPRFPPPERSVGKYAGCKKSGRKKYST
jgi:hypothetical protein